MKRILSLVCVGCLLMLSMPLLSFAGTEQTLGFAQMHGYFRSLGRTVEHANYLYMDNVASGFEVYFEGSGDVTLQATVYCNTDVEIAQYLTVYVDGVRSRVRVACDQRLVEYDKSIVLASGLPQGLHHIEVYRQTEASVSLFYARALTFTGKLLATPPKAPLTIDVIGDSISGGYGCLWNSSLGVADPNANHPKYQDGTQSYAFLAGKALGADVRVTQTSGYGCVGGWNGRDVNLQTMYPLACYWRSGDFAYPFESLADVVVINLGTNDYNTRTQNNMSNAEFQTGAKNLMQMARKYNPNAKIVWCTGMMGTFYKTQVEAAISELGGAAAGYYFLTLPKGMGGAVSHPTAAQQAAAADVLKNFLVSTVLPADYTVTTTASQLQAAIDNAKGIADPSAALQGAIRRAEMELSVNTTDPYRLQARVDELNKAKEATVTGLDLMPERYVTKEPVSDDGKSYVWPFYENGDGSVTMYKSGEGFYWPRLLTPYAQTVDIDETPYWRLDFMSNASFNVSLTYRTPSGELASVNAATLAGVTTTDFEARDRGVTTVDFAAYIRAKGHADSEGLVPIVAADVYVIGEPEQYVRLYECAFTNEAPPPTAICGAYAVENGVLCDVAIGTTAQDLLDRMNHRLYLSVTDESGAAVSGALATGMVLTMTVDGHIVDSAVIAVTGDADGDGKATTSDARGMLQYAQNTTTLSVAQMVAADLNGDGAVNSADVRAVLINMTAMV